MKFFRFLGFVLGLVLFFVFVLKPHKTPVAVDKGRPIPKAFPAELEAVQAEPTSMLDETGKYFGTLEIPPDLAIYPFTISGGGNPPLLALLADDCAYYFSQNRGVKLVKHWLIGDAASGDGSIANAGKQQGANYVIAGKVIPIGKQIRVSALIIVTPLTNSQRQYWYIAVSNNSQKPAVSLNSRFMFAQPFSIGLKSGE